MRNVHERELPVPVAVAGALLDRLASREDLVWPAPAWPPLILDAPLSVGARGGHGPIRYAVESYQPGHSVRFRFAPVMGVRGYHEFSVRPLDDQRCVLRNVLEGRARGGARLSWPLAFRWLHDALIEDLLDRSEQVTGGLVERPARWPRWVRLLRRVSWPHATEVGLPEQARLLHDALQRVDFADAWQISTWRRMPTDPAVWADAIFRDPPHWVRALMLLRNAAVGLVGIERGDPSAFDVLARSEREALVGTDAGHLDFRASILVERGTVTLSTVVWLRNRRGRLYLSAVRLAHPVVVRAMLRRASRMLAGHHSARRQARIMPDPWPSSTAVSAGCISTV